MKITGKCSYFGGPDDEGVAPDEGLAFIYEVEDQPAIFLDYQPPDTSGLARRLDPDTFYVACRWDYDEHPREELLENVALITAPSTGKRCLAIPGDWGPGEQTGRVADLSPGVLDYLGIETDDEVTVEFPWHAKPRTQKVVRISIAVPNNVKVNVDTFEEEEET